MNKSKFLLLIIAALVISNGVLLFGWINGPKSHKEPREIIIKKLHFDDSQIAQYEILISQHQKNIRENETQINQYRKELYQQLNNTTDSEKKTKHYIKNWGATNESRKNQFGTFFGYQKIM